MQFQMNINIKLVTGESFDISVQKDESILSIMQKIFLRKDIPCDQQRLVFNGLQLQVNKNLRDYNISKGSQILLQVEIRNKFVCGKDQVIIQMMSQKSIVLNQINDDEQIKSIQEKIYLKEGISCEQQRLIYKGKQLDPDLTLKDINYMRDEPIHFVSRLRGGGIKSLTFSNMQNKQAVNFGNDQCDWMQLNIGLNLVGKCKSYGCQAYNKTMICQLGIGKFNMGEQIYKVKCPMCKKIGTTDGGCYLWDCYYDIIGMEVYKEDEYRVLNEFAPKEYATYYKGDDDANKTEWKYLNIETRKI